MVERVLSKQVARRFVMGRQGLWPGRRWAGRQGAAEALRQGELLQLDPLNIVARSHDLALLGRVDGLALDDLDALCFEQRAFFDYGEWLFLCPIEELPIWRVIMRRRAEAPRWTHFAAENATVIAHVRDELALRGPLGNRDFNGRPAVDSYRASKDTGLALYYLWVKGEVMTHHRRRWERVFFFSEALVPPGLEGVADEPVAERALILKQIAFLGLCRKRDLFGLLARKVEPDEAGRWLSALGHAGDITAVGIEGANEPYYMLSADLPLIEALIAGDVPSAWAPLGASTLDEVTFVAPLEIVTARRRARALFDFDYVWEVYKPAATRRWGYYTVPILWGEELVARADIKLERRTNTLAVKGFWLERPETGASSAFGEALGRGLARLASFVGATALETAPIEPAGLRQANALEVASVAATKERADEPIPYAGR